LKIENKNIGNPNGFIIEIKDTFNIKNIRYLHVTPKLKIGNLVFFPLSAITGMQVIIVVFIILTFLLLLKGITALTVELRKTRDALWGEMELAQKIQTCLLPQNPQDRKYDIAATMIPAAVVGGDYYDFITGDDGRRWIAIGDVSGHGVSAGLIMMMAQSVVTALIKNKPGISTIEVVSHLNTVLYQNIRERMKLMDYLTFSILVENKPGTFAYAGMHETILVYRSATRTCEEIPTTGPWVGMMENVHPHLKEGTFSLQNGDTLVLYTDGVIEAANADNKQFDVPGLKQSIERNAQLPAAEIVSAVVNDVQNWLKEQKDDITIMALKYLEK
jgi:serine phosphatase RsbU (regulator of sigma subunit)